MKFTLLLTWNFLQNLSMWGFFHFLTCVMFDRTFEMNNDVVKTSYSIFFTKLFKCSLLFIVLKGCFYASSCRELGKCANTAEKCYDFFMINYFQLRNFKSKGQSSFLFIRLHMEVMHSALKLGKSVILGSCTEIFWIK